MNAQDPAPAILVVDDKPANLVAMAALLEPLGHPLVCAASGLEAIARLEEVPVALILMDVQMPHLDGFDTVVRIREVERWRKIPVVFLTAIHSESEYESRGYALGALDYVSKPFDSDMLLARLEALMSWHLHTDAVRREAEQLAHERATREERERILGIVSHDLRSPLGTIRACSEQLVVLGLPERPDALAKRIRRNADRMSRLIHDLVDFSRVQAGGGLEVRPTHLCLADLVTESVDDVRLTHARPIELSVETARTCLVDGDRLVQAVSNLLRNAVEHSGESARVVVRLLDRDDGVELSVWNEGELGLEDADALFDPFRKGAASSGLGLGLYISQHIARAHGGDLTVSSAPGAGTTFRLRVPVAQVASP